MKTIKNTAIAGLACFVLFAFVLPMGQVQAQTYTGQAGAYDDMIKAYQNLLNDPRLDPATRAQIQQMLNQVTQSRNNMQSLAPPNTNSDVNSGANYAPQQPEPAYEPQPAPVPDTTCYDRNVCGANSAQ